METTQERIAAVRKAIEGSNASLLQLVDAFDRSKEAGKDILRFAQQIADQNFAVTDVLDRLPAGGAPGPAPAPDPIPDPHPPQAAIFEVVNPGLPVIKGQAFTGQHTPTVASFYEDCTFDGQGASYALLLNKQEGSIFNRCKVTNARKGILGNSFIFANGEVFDCFEDGINLDGDDWTIAGSYLHGFGTAPDAHADAIQVLLGSRGKILGNDIVVPGDATHLSNACILLKSDFGLIDDIEIRGNTLDGGLRHIQVRQKSTRIFPVPSNVVFEENIHLRYVLSLADGIKVAPSNDISKAIKMVLPEYKGGNL